VISRRSEATLADGFSRKVITIVKLYYRTAQKNLF
jgi:hypothetical protein